MLAQARGREQIGIGGGVLFAVLLLALINAGVIFSGSTRTLRLANITPGQVKLFGATDEPHVAGGDYTVDGAATITAAQIDGVLTEYGSPAQGMGQQFVDLGAKYGINPAYALAFYIHESAAGTKGVARFTRSIGNIRTTPGYKDYEGYRSYDSFEQSIEDWYKLIRDLYIDGWGLRSVDQILMRYAPPSDNNNTAAYIQNVEYLVDSWR